MQARELLKPQRDESVRLEITLNAEDWKELEKARRLLSHCVPEGSWAEVIGVLAQKFNQAQLGRNEKKSTQDSVVKMAPPRVDHVEEISKAPKKNSRPFLSLKLKRELLLKAQHQCEYKDSLSQLRCEAQHFLAIDHIFPLSLGGRHASQNLRVLCRTHNQLLARQWGISSRY